MMKEAEQEKYMNGIANAYNVLGSIYHLKDYSTCLSTTKEGNRNHSTIRSG